MANAKQPWAWRCQTSGGGTEGGGPGRVEPHTKPINNGLMGGEYLSGQNQSQ